MREPIQVSPAEAGQKLLAFLERRFTVPRSVLHRWIRSGQVRINGGRAKAFDRVDNGAIIRVPPFAEVDERTINTSADRPTVQAETAKPLEVVAETEHLAVFCKPSGLPVHPGTGHQDCLTARLAIRYAGAAFMPAPAHRLDRDTSGLVLVAKTYAELRRLSDAFAGNSTVTLTKEYLAWVRGDCPWVQPCRLQDTLMKKADASGRERMVTDAEANGKDAALSVVCVQRRTTSSLVLVRLHTGRTHQIRVQLAARGFPLIGDVKYGGPACSDGMKLHAARIRIAETVYESIPQWTGEWAVRELSPFPE